MVHSIAEAVYRRAQDAPGALCLASAQEEVSYGEYWRLVVRLARALQQRGLAPGGYVVAVAQHSVAYLASQLAVQLAGGIFVPLEKGVGAARVEQIAAQCGAFLVLGGPGEASLSFAGLLAEAEGQSEDNPFALPRGETVCEVLFTTGTTGASKGVVMRHDACVAVAGNVRHGVEMREGNVELVPVPLNHSYGLRRYYANMLAGGTVLLSDGVLFAGRVFELLGRYGATAMALVPAAAAVLLQYGEKELAALDGKLDYVQIGSAALPEAHKKALRRLLPHARLYNFYGSSEAGCSCIINYNSPEDRPFCIGRPTVNARFQFVDEARRPLTATSEAAPGLLATAGGMVMEGYFGDEALTAETLQDGWVYSNDLAWQDGDGLVYVAGRRDDVINVGGGKVAPLEVEQAAGGVPGVADCACCGAPDEVLGQVPVLFVVAGEGYSPKALAAELKRQLEPYKLPRQYRLIDAIPRTYNGKIDRRTLSEMARRREA